jgi:hypothetical protein
MRFRIAGFVGALLVAIAVAGAVVVHRSGGAPSMAQAAFRGSVPPSGIAMPAFALRDQDGRVLRTADLRTWRATQNAGEDLTPANLAHDIRVVLRSS